MLVLFALGLRNVAQGIDVAVDDLMILMFNGTHFLLLRLMKEREPKKKRYTMLLFLCDLSSP